MTNPNSSLVEPSSEANDSDDSPVCVMTFNANDPSGVGGLTADLTAIVSAGAHPLAVVTGTYVRDTSNIVDFIALDEEAITLQARTVLEDMPVSAFKVGFLGGPESISVIAQIAADYPNVVLIAYMPDLSWWDTRQIDNYLDAFRELLLPQTTILVGNHSTLWRWLLPDWAGERSPSGRDIAIAAAEQGAPYTLVTGMVLPEQFIDNVLATEKAVLLSGKFERFDAVFCGAGDTLSAALTALLANGNGLEAAATEALSYLDSSLDGGFQPGMGNAVPDRMFWAQPETETQAGTEPDATSLELPPHATKQ